MATRARIAVVLVEDGEQVVRSMYSHYDGYPSGVGVVLERQYKEQEDVEALVFLGDASTVRHGLAGHVLSGHAYTDYGRRSDERRYAEHESVDALLVDKVVLEDYLYVFEDGEWRAYITSGGEVHAVRIPELSAREQHSGGLAEYYD